MMPLDYFNDQKHDKSCHDHRCKNVKQRTHHADDQHCDHNNDQHDKPARQSHFSHLTVPVVSVCFPPAAANFVVILLSAAGSSTGTPVGIQDTSGKQPRLTKLPQYLFFRSSFMNLRIDILPVISHMFRNLAARHTARQGML